MHPQCRRAVAFIAAGLELTDVGRSIVDLTSNQVCSFEGDLSPKRVAISNAEDGNYFTGASTNGVLSIFDHERRRFFTFERDGKQFWGFDYGSSSYYAGSLEGHLVQIADEQVDRVFSYSLGFR